MAAIGLALGLGLSLRTIKQTRSILLLTWLGAGLFFLSIIAAFPPRHTHLVTIIPVLALLSALGFAVSADTLVSELAKRWSPTLRNWVQKGLIVAVSSMLLFSGMREYFITMPIRNPPLFEDIVSWIAWRTEEPFNIIYLDSTEKTPHRVEYHVNTGMVPHTYDSVSTYNFNWENVPENSIVFLDPGEESVPGPPSGFDNSATYVNMDGETIGYAWSDTDVDLEPEPAFPITISEFPVTIILAFSALVIIVFVLMTVQIRIGTEKTDDRPGLRIRAEITLREIFKKETDTEL